MNFGWKKCAVLGLAVSSVGVVQSPAAAQDPFEDVFVSSFQRTCENISASVDPESSSIELQADCLNSAGLRGPASLTLRGVHEQSDSYVTMTPTFALSDGLEGCAVTEIVPLENRVNIDLVCDSTGSTLRVYEVTNDNGELVYETEKIYRIAAESAAANVRSDGQELAIGEEATAELQARVQGLLDVEDEGQRPETQDQRLSADGRHILLDRSPDYDQAAVVSLTPTIDDEGNGNVVGSVELYDDADAALAAFEALVADDE